MNVFVKTSPFALIFITYSPPQLFEESSTSGIANTGNSNAPVLSAAVSSANTNVSVPLSVTIATTFAFAAAVPFSVTLPHFTRALTLML